VRNVVQLSSFQIVNIWCSVTVAGMSWGQLTFVGAFLPSFPLSAPSWLYTVKLLQLLIPIKFGVF